jgi:hypothetical protein
LATLHNLPMDLLFEVRENLFLLHWMPLTGHFSSADLWLPPSVRTFTTRSHEKRV